MAEETVGAVAGQLPERGQGGTGDGAPNLVPPEQGWRVRALTTGWIAQISSRELLASAFDEIRRSAASLPSVGTALVETLGEVYADLAEDGIIDRGRTDPLVRQAQLVLAAVEKAGQLPEDAERGARRCCGSAPDQS